MPRAYTALTTDDQAAMRVERIRALEAEHYANTLAVVSARASVTLAMDSKNVQQVEQAEANLADFESNVATLDATLDALLADQ